MSWRVVIRERGATRKVDVGTLADAIHEARGAAGGAERRETATAFVREVAPDAQVVVRVELAGPGRARGGLDVRGDGSWAAWTGRWSKRIVEPGRGEDALDALVRELSRKGS